MTDPNLESLNKSLNSDDVREKYKTPHDNYKTSHFARISAFILVSLGNLVYGKSPSYKKFKAIELVARIPYQSWIVASYTLLTLFYTNEKKAIELSQMKRFSRIAQDNETMHVVVISQLVKKHHGENFLTQQLLPLLFSFVYFQLSFLLYIIHRKSSLELNYLFEDHAYQQYDMFVKENELTLKTRDISDSFLRFYGRNCDTEYEFFCSVRNDELIHRNMSIEKILE